MRKIVSTSIGLVASLGAAPLLCAVGCDPLPISPIYSGDLVRDEGGQEAEVTDPCLMARLYLVEGDQFTFMSGMSQTISPSDRGQTDNPTMARPDIEPRVKATLEIHRYDGQAQLLWNDAVVDQFDIDKQFLLRAETETLAYEDPDGTRVELHVYSRAECGGWPAPLLTRAEVEALESAN